MNDKSKQKDKQVKESSVPPEGQSSQTSGASMTEIINVIADRVDPVIHIIKTIAESSLNSRRSDSQFRIHMAWIAVAVVAIIVGVATFLTFKGKLDGSTYGFLLGLIVGYVLTFIRDAISPDKKE